MNDSSILTDIKMLCGVPEDIHDFDQVILMHCNSVFSGLTQLGLGPKKGFYVSDKYVTWSDIIDEEVNLHNVKSYMYIKVKLLFDPPANATLINSMNQQSDELEWRIRMELENNTKGDI